MPLILALRRQSYRCHCNDTQEGAFEQRVLELEPRLYRTACAILWNDADAADALQECLLKAWRKRGSLKEEACFNSWITRILINECHTLRYRLRRHKTVSFDEAVGDVPAGEPVDLGLRDALRAVPEHLRLPLLLHHMEGYSLQEVADMLHISVAAARGRVYQARQKLRQQLDKEEQQP